MGEPANEMPSNLRPEWANLEAPPYPDCQLVREVDGAENALDNAVGLRLIDESAARYVKDGLRLHRLTISWQPCSKEAVAPM